MYEQHRAEFDKVLAKMSRRVPGIAKVEAVSTVDGRIVLRSTLASREAFAAGNQRPPRPAGSRIYSSRLASTPMTSRPG